MLQIAIVEDEADLAQQTKDNDVRYLNEHGLEGNIAVFNDGMDIGESSIPLTTSVNSEFWIAAQKAAIRNGMMNEDKQQMLASIGVVYGQFKRNNDWQENYNYVKAYYEQHKQLPVGVNSRQMSTGSQSGYWIGFYAFGRL